MKNDIIHEDSPLYCTSEPSVVAHIANIAAGAKAGKKREQALSDNWTLFNRLLVVAETRVIKWEPTSVQLTLAHPDGTLGKTNKSSQIPHLEKGVPE